jgi:hypothetical protein
MSMATTFCVTPRFICHNRNCGSCRQDAHSSTWNGWDQQIRNQLPSGIQRMFPYQFEHRALVAESIINELLLTSVLGTSVAEQAALYKQRALDLFRASEVAWKERLAAAKSSNPPQAPFDGGKTPLIKDCSEFDDPKGNNGWVPKKNFFRRLLQKELRRTNELHTRLIQLVGGIILKGDHSRKTAKFIRIRNDRVYKSVWSMMNEYNEIVGLWFTVGETNEELAEVLKGLVHRYKMHGLEGPAIFFTDICCNQREFLKKVILCLFESLML